MTRYTPKPVSVPLDEDDVDFDISNGHDHDGVDSKLIDAADQMVIYNNGSQVNHEDIEKLDFQDPLTATWSEPSKQVSVVVESNICKIESGSFSGDNSPNRAIPHGLGVTPKYIKLVLGNYADDLFLLVLGKFQYFDNINKATHDVTPWTSTNFYVGNTTNYNQSGNGSAYTYSWVAFG